MLWSLVGVTGSIGVRLVVTEKEDHKESATGELCCNLCLTLC